MSTLKKKKTDRSHLQKDLEWLANEATVNDMKIPISIRLDGDVYKEVRKRAKSGEGDGKYQTLINEILRTHLLGKPMNELTVKEILSTILEKIEDVSHKSKMKKAANE